MPILIRLDEDFCFIILTTVVFLSRKCHFCISIKRLNNITDANSHHPLHGARENKTLRLRSKRRKLQKADLFLLSNSFMVFSPSCDDSKPFHIWKWPRAGVVSFCCCRLAASRSETAAVPGSFCTKITGRGRERGF